MSLNPFDANPLLANDRPWSYRVSGVYQFPWQIFASGTFMHMVGAPETTTVNVTGNTISLPQGSQAVVARTVGSVRMPNQLTLDMSFQKHIRFASGQRLSPRVELFNLANNASILGGSRSWARPTTGRTTCSWAACGSSSSATNSRKTRHRRAPAMAIAGVVARNRPASPHT